MSIQIPREAVRYDAFRDGDRRFILMEIKKGSDGQPRWRTVDQNGREELLPLKPAAVRRPGGIGILSDGKEQSSGKRKKGSGWLLKLILCAGLAAAGYHYFVHRDSNSITGEGSAGYSPASEATGPFQLKSAASVEGITGEELSYMLRVEPSPDSLEVSGLPSGIKWRGKSRTLTGKAVLAGDFPVKIKARQGELEGEISLMLRIKPGSSGESPLPGPPLLLPAEKKIIAGRPFAMEIRCPQAAEFSAGDGLPHGLTLEGRVLRGTVTDPGRHEFKVTARNSSGEDETTITLIVLAPPEITLALPVPSSFYSGRLLEIRFHIPEAAKNVKWEGPLPNGVTFRRINSYEWALKGVPRGEGAYEGQVRARQETESGNSEEISLPVSFKVEKVSLARQWWTATCDRNSNLEADLVSYPFSLAYKDEPPEIFDSKSDFLKMIYNRDFITSEIRMSQFTEEGTSGALTLTRVSPIRTNVVNIKFHLTAEPGDLISRMELDASDATYYAPALNRANIENFLRAYLAAGSWSGSTFDDPAERQSMFFSPSSTVRYFNEDYGAGSPEGRSLKEKLRNDYRKDMARKSSWTYQPDRIEIEITGDAAAASYNLNAIGGGFPRHRINIKATTGRLEIVSAATSPKK